MKTNREGEKQKTKNDKKLLFLNFSETNSSAPPLISKNKTEEKKKKEAKTKQNKKLLLAGGLFGYLTLMK